MGLKIIIGTYQKIYIYYHWILKHNSRRNNESVHLHSAIISYVSEESLAIIEGNNCEHYLLLFLETGLNKFQAFTKSLVNFMDNGLVMKTLSGQPLQL
jgi:hypothetical protein